MFQELVTEKDYVWSRIDKTESGRPITDIVDMVDFHLTFIYFFFLLFFYNFFFYNFQGISVPYAASDCVGALLKELKRYSSSGKIRFLVAIDAANSLFGRTTVRRSDRKFVNTADLTLVHCMKKLLSNDWVWFSFFLQFFFLASCFKNYNNFSIFLLLEIYTEV